MKPVQLKAKIAALYAALAAMVLAGQITEADKTALGPVLVKALLERESIED